MNTWKKTWIITLIFALLIGFVPVPTHFNPVQANPTGEDHFVYLPLVTNILPTIIPDSTNILTDESNQYLVSISADTVRFVFSRTTPELNRVEPGHVIVSDIADKAPNGYLRKVLTKDLVNGQVVLTTAPASLEEAIQQASVSFNYQFTSDDIVAANLLPGVTLTVQDSASPSLEVINLALDGVLLGGDLVASGNLAMNLSLEFGFSIGFFSLKNMRLVLHGTENASLQLRSLNEASGEDEYTIGTFHLQRLHFMVGAFPIIVQPTIVVMVGADGSVSASMTTGVTQSASLRGGVKYENGELSPVKDFDHDFWYQEPSISAQMEARAYASAGLELAFYSVSPLNPELALTVRVGPKIQADESLCWVLKGFLEVDLAARLRFISHDLAEIGTTIFSTEKLLAQGRKCTPLEISGNSHGFGAMSRSSASDHNSSPPSVYDYQDDNKQLLTPDERLVRDVSLATSTSAIANGTTMHTSSIGSVAYQTVTNSLGIPSILSATVTFDTGWSYNPNGHSYVSGYADGYYVIVLSPWVAGDFVLNYSGEVDRIDHNSGVGPRGGLLTFASLADNFEITIPDNGNGVFARSVAADSTYMIYFWPHGVYGDATGQPGVFPGPISSGTARTTLTWTFIPGGIQ